MRALTAYRLALLLPVLGSGIPAPTAEAQSLAERRLIVSGDAGIQTTVNTRIDLVDFDLNNEIGRFAAAQELGRGTVFSAGVAARIWRRIGIGITTSYIETRSDATIDAEVPHPFFFEFPRAATAVARDLAHRELALHVQGQYWLTLGDRWLLTVFMGPTFFEGRQELVAAITTVEGDPPFDAVSIVAHHTEEVRVRRLGYNIGVDVAYFRWERLGLAFKLRYSRTTPAVQLEGRFQPALELGGTHAVGGIRVAF